MVVSSCCYRVVVLLEIVVLMLIYICKFMDVKRLKNRIVYIYFIIIFFVFEFLLFFGVIFDFLGLNDYLFVWFIFIFNDIVLKFIYVRFGN